jgi:ABC-type multidrug transport system permease subunit
MNNALFIAWHDIRYQMRQGATLLWMFVMPPIFFYFIGTVTGGFSSGMSGGAASPLVIEAASPGFMKEHIDRRLQDNDFETEWRDPGVIFFDEEETKPQRTLVFSEGLSQKIVDGGQVTALYDTSASATSRDYEKIRINRGLYTVLADIVAADAQSDQPLNAAVLADLAAEPKIWQLRVEPAGNRQEIPSGFEQAIPGILVMFTLLVLLTSGASMLTLERNQGLLRRLASAPLSRTQIVSGKWGGRMALAVLQVGVAIIIGTWLFRMHWGPDLGMVIIVLGAWGAFCASAGLLLGSLARTEGQAVGLGVLTANLLAALGGCWWPIEITPQWMQFVQKLLPTGWTMDALHKLISFESGAMSAWPHVIVLLVGTLVISALAIHRFRYE